jgi:hypothetical protein
MMILSTACQILQSLISGLVIKHMVLIVPVLHTTVIACDCNAQQAFLSITHLISLSNIRIASQKSLDCQKQAIPVFVV